MKLSLCTLAVVVSSPAGCVFLQVEVHLLLGTSSDRGVVLYDTRAGTPVRKNVMQTRCNAAAWNPLEGMAFVVANEDCCLYTYDMRDLSTAACVHKVSGWWLVGGGWWVKTRWEAGVLWEVGCGMW